MEAFGRPDESLAVEFVGPLQPNGEDSLQSGKRYFISLQKGQLKATIRFLPLHSANLEVPLFGFKCLILMLFSFLLKFWPDLCVAYL